MLCFMYNVIKKLWLFGMVPCQALHEYKSVNFQIFLIYFLCSKLWEGKWEIQ